MENYKKFADIEYEKIIQMVPKFKSSSITISDKIEHMEAVKNLLPKLTNTFETLCKEHFEDAEIPQEVEDYNTELYQKFILENL